MDAELARAAELPLYREHVAWLRCFHGVDPTVAMIFVAELHGIDRFENPRALAAYLGIVPSVHASGDMARGCGSYGTHAFPSFHASQGGPELRNG